MSKTKILWIVVACVAACAVVGLSLGLYFGLRNNGPQNPYVTIEVNNKVYDGKALDVNVLVSQNTTYEIYFKEKTASDEQYTLTTPINAGDYDIKVVATRGDNEITEVASAEIYQKELTISGLTATEKVYDGTTSVNISNGFSLIGVVEGDSVELNSSTFSAFYENADVEQDKEVIVSGLSISGDDISNYIFNIPTITASILPKEVTISGITANDKYFDDTTSAVISGEYTFTGLLTDEQNVSIAGELVAHFVNSEIGNDKEIILSGLSLTGSNAKNYLLVYPELTANILYRDVYVLTYLVNNNEWGYITGETTQNIFAEEDGTSVTAVANNGYRFVEWSDGVLSATRTDRNVIESKTITAIFEEYEGFDFVNGFSSATLGQTASVDENGYIQVTKEDTEADVTTLTERVVLMIDDSWTLETSFKMADVSGSAFFTIMGVLGGGTINALQVNLTQIRFCMQDQVGGGISDVYKTFGATLELNVDYHLILTNDGGQMYLTIEEIDGEVVVNNFEIDYSTASSDYVVNCNVIGNSFYNGGNQQTAGVIYSLHIQNNQTGPFNITYNVNNADMGYIEGNANQTVESGQNGTEVTAVANPGYEFQQWSDGVKTATRYEQNVTASKTITAIFIVEGAIGGFNFVNEISSATLSQTASVDEYGNIQVSFSDTPQTVTTLTETIDLLTTDAWIMTSEFLISGLNGGGHLTFFGVSSATGGDDAYALQISQTQLRIYMGQEFGVSLDTTLSFNTRYKITLSSDGSGQLNLIIEDLDNTSTVVSKSFAYSHPQNYVVHCNVIGNSFIGSVNTNQGSQGTIYSMHLTNAEQVNEFSIKYTVNDSNMGYITGETNQTVVRGEDGTEVTAVANPGYKFHQWSDGVKTATRYEQNVTSSKTITAIFLPEDVSTSFDFVNEINDIVVSEMPNYNYNGYLEVVMNDTLENAAKLSGKLTLLKSQGFTITTKFAITELMGSGFLSIFGTSAANTAQEAFALQISLNQIRIFMGGPEQLINFTTSLSYNTDYILTFTSNGNNTISINIKTAENESAVYNETVNYTSNTDYLVNCDIIGNTFFGSDDQNGAGKIYYIHITEAEVQPPITVEYILTYTVNNEEMGYITGETNQTITQGGNATAVTAVANDGYRFVRWSDGVATATRTDENITSSQTITAIFEGIVEISEFDFQNSFNDSIIVSSQAIDQDGYIQVTTGDSISTLTTLSPRLVLTSEQIWTIESKFKMTLVNSNNCFTFFGISNGDIYALQIHQTQLRIYVADGNRQDNRYDLINSEDSPVTLEFDKDYILTLSSNGQHCLVLSIEDVETSIKVVENMIIEYDEDTVVSADAIGNSMYNGGNQGSSGTIYYIHITNTYTGPDKPLGDVYTVSYTVNDEEMGYITGDLVQTIKSGENGTRVTAVANSGYRFTGWSDGVLTATRVETNVTETKTITANFELITTVEEFDFVNNVNNITINSPASVDENGYIQVALDDAQGDVTTLTDKLVLLSTDTWTMETSFTITQLDSGGYFTFFGTYEAGSAGEVFALQISTTDLRIYMGQEDGVLLDATLSLNTRYNLTLSSDGTGNLTLVIENNSDSSAVVNKTFEYTHQNNYVVNCDVIGNSFFLSNGIINQGSAGEIYYIHINKTEE